MAQNSFLYIINSAPYSSAAGLEGLDAVLMGCAFELPVDVLFMHDGVFHLHHGQQAAVEGLKPYTDTFKALDDFGVRQVYVDASSLMARDLTQDNLMLAVESLEGSQVQDLIANSGRVMRF